MESSGSRPGFPFCKLRPGSCTGSGIDNKVFLPAHPLLSSLILGKVDEKGDVSSDTICENHRHEEFRDALYFYSLVQRDVGSKTTSKLRDI